MIKRPDEKLVITFVTYLCSRLLAVSREVHACRILQRNWRRVAGIRRAAQEKMDMKAREAEQARQKAQHLQRQARLEEERKRKQQQLEEAERRKRELEQRAAEEKKRREELEMMRAAE